MAVEEIFNLFVPAVVKSILSAAVEYIPVFVSPVNEYDGAVTEPKGASNGNDREAGPVGPVTPV